MTFQNMSTEALVEFEQRLYDDEVAGMDTWETRDAIIWELHLRGYFDTEPSAADPRSLTQNPT
jgi:hypothetical protein